MVGWPGAGEDEGIVCWGSRRVEHGRLGGTYWSASAIASASGGGIMKQTPGALIFSPELSATSQTSPLFFCRV